MGPAVQDLLPLLGRVPHEAVQRKIFRTALSPTALQCVHYKYKSADSDKTYTNIKHTCYFKTSLCHVTIFL